MGVGPQTHFESRSTFYEEARPREFKTRQPLIQYAAHFSAPECGPPFCSRMRPSFLVQNAAHFLGPACGPLVWSRMRPTFLVRMRPTCPSQNMVLAGLATRLGIHILYVYIYIYIYIYRWSAATAAPGSKPCQHRILAQESRPHSGPEKWAAFWTSKVGRILAQKSRPHSDPEKWAAFCTRKVGRILDQKSGPHVGSAVDVF